MNAHEDQFDAMPIRPPEPSGVRQGLVMGLWAGVLTGLLEVLMVVSQRTLIAPISMETLRTNRHFAWMIPLADALLFGLLGAVVGLLLCSRPRLRRRVLGMVFGGFFAIALLLRLEGLYPYARTVLTLGCAVAAGRWVAHTSPAFDRRLRAGLIPLAGALALLCGVGCTWVATAEWRALRALPPSAPGAPNVLLLVLDNVRASSLSLYGYGRPTTPNLERLAREGVRFDFARATAPWTLPSHASMFTGRWPHELSAGWDRALDATYPTLAEHLAAHGYATAGFVGNVYYANERYGLGRGFARFEDYYENLTVSPLEIVLSSSLGLAAHRQLGLSGKTDLWRRKTAALLNTDLLGWLSRRPAARPFFAFVNYYDAHAPCVVPDDAPRKFGQCVRPERERICALTDFRTMSERGHPPAGRDAETITHDATEILHDSYESCIAYIDDQLGRLFAALDQGGLRENTLVIVVADHGEHFNERGYLGHGQSVYRPEVDVPLVIFPPARAAAAGVVTEAVSLRDLPSTVVDLLDLESSAPFPGRSLARYWDGTATGNRGSGPVLSEVEQKPSLTPMTTIPAMLGPVKAIVSGRRVYIHNTNGQEELYDLKTDPHERTNLVYTPEGALAVDDWRRSLQEILADSDQPPRATEPGRPVLDEAYLGSWRDELASLNRPGREGSAP